MFPFFSVCASVHNALLVVGTRKFLYRCCGHLHYLRPRPETEDEDMGPYDRALRERREDA